MKMGLVSGLTTAVGNVAYRLLKTGRDKNGPYNWVDLIVHLCTVQVGGTVIQLLGDA